jgi:hypothetical protein
MNRLRTQAKILCLSLAAALSGLAAALSAGAQGPSAEEILRVARMNQIGQEARLRAQLRTDEDETPFRIVLDGGIVRYQFDDPAQEIQLRMHEDTSELLESTGGKTAAVRPARYDERVRGTPVTYEDLALRLLYWPRPKLLGEEVLRTRRAWKLEIQAPRGASQYGVARLWIDQKSGAVLRIEGYNLKGRLLKRFEAISAQKIDGETLLKTMRIESYDPETRKVIDRTYLEVLGRDE